MSADDPEAPLRLRLRRPKEADASSQDWTLVAHNKRVLAGWNSSCANTPANAAHCHDWLSANAMLPKPGRCYPLRGKVHAGIWCYEIGRGDRVYYKPDSQARKAIVYYAGPHPPNAPSPPKDL